MSCSWWLVGLLVLPLQVPRPDAGENVGRQLETARRSILAREAADLGSLGRRIIQDGGRTGRRGGA